MSLNAALVTGLRRRGLSAGNAQASRVMSCEPKAHNRKAISAYYGPRVSSLRCLLGKRPTVISNSRCPGSAGFCLLFILMVLMNNELSKGP